MSATVRKLVSHSKSFFSLSLVLRAFFFLSFVGLIMTFTSFCGFQEQGAQGVMSCSIPGSELLLRYVAELVRGRMGCKRAGVGVNIPKWYNMNSYNGRQCSSHSWWDSLVLKSFGFVFRGRAWERQGIVWILVLASHWNSVKNMKFGIRLTWSLTTLVSAAYCGLLAQVFEPQFHLSDKNPNTYLTGPR